MSACSLDDRGRLSGTVTFENLAAVRQSGEAFIEAAGSESVTLDCSGLESSSSVAVALLVALRRSARAGGRSVSFSGAPLALRHIAAFSGVEDLLGLDD